MYPDEVGEPPTSTLLFRYRIAIVIGIVSLVCIAGAIILLFKTTQTSEPIRFSGIESSGSAQTQEITVDIEGAVVKPGVYRLPSGSRIEDLLLVAGGFTDDADNQWVGKNLNRAALLLDGGKIYISTQGQSTSAESNAGGSVAGTNTPSGLISINSASAKELDTLPGVGEVTAEKIIAGRPYQTIDELLLRKIVGQAVFEKIKASLTL